MACAGGRNVDEGGGVNVRVSIEHLKEKSESEVTEPLGNCWRAGVVFAERRVLEEPPLCLRDFSEDSHHAMGVEVNHDAAILADGAAVEVPDQCSILGAHQVHVPFDKVCLF